VVTQRKPETRRKYKRDYFTRKSEGNSELGRPKYKWENNVMINKETLKIEA
jgi:hypothetical protein